MNKLIVLVVVVVLLLGGGWFLMSRQPSSATMTQSVEVSPSLAPAEISASPHVSQVVGESSDEKVFTVTGSNFSFDPKEIKVKQGDHVKIIFQNKDGIHDWRLDEFEVKTTQITAGNSAEVSFVADKTGSFEYYCSVGRHRAMGMKGNLIVE